MDEEREMVLRMLKEGKISVEEVDALLQERVDQPAGEGSASTGGRVASEIGADLRRELHRTREAFTPSFVDVVRGLRGLAEGRAETTTEEPMRAGKTLDLRQAWGDQATNGDVRVRGR